MHILNGKLFIVNKFSTHFELLIYEKRKPLVVPSSITRLNDKLLCESNEIYLTNMRYVLAVKNGMF